MFSYIMLGTNDMPGTIRVYDSLMELPGHPKAGRNEDGASRGTFGDNYTTELSVGRPFNQQPANIGNGTMVAFNAHSSELIQQLYTLALSLGDREENFRATGRNMLKDFIVPMYAIRMGISYHLSITIMLVDSFICWRNALCSVQRDIFYISALSSNSGEGGD